MLELSILCTRFEVIIVVLSSRSTENICSSGRGAQKKERQDETQFTTKIDGKTSLRPSYFVL